MGTAKIQNPFRPGAGHPPPHLAGRGKETNEFVRMLDQSVILENLVLTGLRGVGKTVLLDSRFKSLAIAKGWLWVGTDLSEAATVSEEKIAMRLITDLAVATARFPIGDVELRTIGFSRHIESRRLDYPALCEVYRVTPGLVGDKVRSVLEFAWECIKNSGIKGIVFAYDEAQNMTDHAMKEQFPLSLMLDCFQAIQKRGIPFMLIMTGLPTLFPKLVESRTFSERMFRVVTIDRLSEPESRDAIVKPIEEDHCPVKLSPDGIRSIINESAGYPYFIQFLCKETYDSVQEQQEAGIDNPQVFIEDIIRKLDADFYLARWSKATDRQRELLIVTACLKSSHKEFTLQEVSAASNDLLDKPFSPSHVSQMFTKLGELGLIYKNRHGKYAFAVPLMHEFIKRQET